MVEEGVEFNEEGFIVDFLDGSLLKDTPEERVRQRFMKTLYEDYGYPKYLMRREVPIQSGASIILNEKDGSPKRADIVVYNCKPAAMRKDQGNILFVVECKQPNRQDGYAQLVSYVFNTSAIGGVWTNDKGMDVYRVRRKPQQGLEELLSLPRYKENWEEEERIPRKSDLQRPHNVRFLLSQCHNKLYGRGMENEDFDLAMDMVRILLAKIQDETSAGEYAKFWITNADYKTK